MTLMNHGFRQILLAPLLVLGGWSWAGATPDRCNPQMATPATQVLQIGVADAPAGLTMVATTAVQLILPAAGSEPRLNEGLLAEDLQVGAMQLGFGDLRANQAQLSASAETAFILATAGNDRYRLSLRKGSLLDGNGSALVLRPVFGSATSFSIKRGASMVRGDDGRWKLGAGAQLAWVATIDKPLQLVLRDPASLTVAAPDAPKASLELASARVSPGAPLPLLVRGAGAELNDAVFRVCISNKLGKAVDISAKRLADENDITSLAVAVPAGLIDALSASPTRWERLWGEPVRLRLVAWKGTQPVMELADEVRMTRPGIGLVFGLAVLFIVYVFAALFKGVWMPLALFGSLIRHAKTGRYSLTSFQTLCWTLLVIVALCFSWYCSGVLLELRPDVLQLLGIVGGSHLLTRAVEAAKPPTASTPQPSQSPLKVDLVTDPETGEFDILRFQMLAFTVFSLLYAAVNVWLSHGLPELPQSLYWLMGLGNVVHVAGKLPEAIGGGAKPAATLTSFEAQLSADRIRAVQVILSVAQTGVLDAPTREALTQYMSANGYYPVGYLTEALLKKMGVPP